MENRIGRSKMSSSVKTKNEALDTKYTKKETRARWEQQKRLEEQKAQQMKLMIRYQQQEAQQKRQMDLIEKQNRTRSQIEGKLQREAYEQNLYEKEIGRMEQEELELIMRLKNTRLLEEQAHFELESAIKDPLEEKTMQQSTMSKKSAAKSRSSNRN